MAEIIDEDKRKKRESLPIASWGGTNTPRPTTPTGQPVASWGIENLPALGVNLRNASDILTTPGTNPKTGPPVASLGIENLNMKPGSVGDLINRTGQNIRNFVDTRGGFGAGNPVVNTTANAAVEPATNRTEPAINQPERTPIDTGAMGRAKTVPEAMSKINAMGANRPERLPDQIIEQPGASETNLRKWTDDQGRVHIEGGSVGPGVGGGGAGGGGGEYSAATAQAREVMAGIDTMVNQLMGNRGNYLPGGAMGKNTKNLIASLVGNKTTLAGQSLSAATSMEGHGVNAKINADVRREAQVDRRTIERDKLSETARHNNILEKDFQLRLSNQKDTARANALEKSIQNQAYYEQDPMNPGNKQVNRKLTYFGMAESGQKIPEEIEDAVSSVKKEFETFYKRTLAVNKDVKDTPSTRAEAKQMWMKKQLIFQQ